MTNVDPGLFVRKQKGRYSVASADEIMDAARQVVDQRMQRGSSFRDPSVARAFFCDKLRAYEREVFTAVFLDARHKLIEYAELFFGTIDGAEVHPRSVVERALAHSAAAVILGHNHPSGNAEPSAADRSVTTRIKQALGLVEIRLLDHFVIGDGVPTSMARLGMV